MTADDSELAGPVPTDLGWSLGVILRRWHDQVDLAVAGLPHGTRGFQILSVISQGEPPTQSGLAKHLSIDTTVMPYIIDSLEVAGLLKRRVDARDRRVKRIVITAKGSDVHAELEVKVREAEHEVFRSAPADLRAGFAERAERLALAIQTPTANEDACSVVIDALAMSSETPA